MRVTEHNLKQRIQQICRLNLGTKVCIVKNKNNITT